MGEPAEFAEWERSDDPVKRAHVANIRARRAAAASRPAEFPPLARQAANLAGAAARFVASGLETTTPEERAERLAVCRGCDRFEGGRCKICGCQLGLKIAMASEHCPLDPPKW